MSSKFEFKIYKKSLTSIYRILVRISQGMYPSQIARQLNMSKSHVNYFLKRLERCGYIKREFRTNFVCYSLTEKGNELLKNIRSSKFSLPVREKHVRTHTLTIKFPILKDNPEAKFDSKVEINNWIKQYALVTFPIGITIEKTTKHVVVYFHKFYTKQSNFLSDFFSWVLRGVYYVYYYLMKEKGIQIDIFSGEIIRQHIANESPEFNKRVERKKTVEVSLNRKAKAIYPANFVAKAWIDRSLGNVEIETNDMVYEEKLLLMPEIVHALDKKLAPVLENLTKQINLHLEIQTQHIKAISELRQNINELVKVIKKMEEKL